jgi:hypothetical protein
MKRSELRVGGKYQKYAGAFVRTVEGIEGERVRWRDHCGPGECSLKLFLRDLSPAPDSGDGLLPPPPTEEPKKVSLRAALIDAANTVTIFRNDLSTVQRIVGPLEWRLSEAERLELRLALDRSSDLLGRLQGDLNGLR